MNLIKQHPNWTLLTVWLGGLVIYMLSVLAFAETDNAGLIVVVLVVYVVVLISTTGLVLRRKGRSLGYLLLFPVVGIIPILVALLSKGKE